MSAGVVGGLSTLGMAIDAKIRGNTARRDLHSANSNTKLQLALSPLKIVFTQNMCFSVFLKAINEL